MNTELKKQFRKDNPQTIGETDSHFDLSNYNDWLENKYFELLKQNQEMREMLSIILPMFTELDAEFGKDNPRENEWTEKEIQTIQRISDFLESTEVKP